MPIPVPRPAHPATESQVVPALDPDCAAVLGSREADIRPSDGIHHGQCGAPFPVTLAAVILASGERIAIEPPAVMRCQTAAAVIAWTRDVVAPAAASHLNEPVTAMRNAASYDCRGRNRVAGARLSEHGRANALDISAFQRASGVWIEVAAPGAAQDFLSDVRKKACGPFTTVLGPGSDAHHSDHLHLDLARRGRDARGLWCK